MRRAFDPPTKDIPQGVLRKVGMHMSINDFLAIVSFGLSCIEIGMLIGKKEKQPPRSAKSGDYFR